MHWTYNVWRKSSIGVSCKYPGTGGAGRTGRGRASGLLEIGDEGGDIAGSELGGEWIVRESETGKDARATIGAEMLEDGGTERSLVNTSVRGRSLVSKLDLSNWISRLIIIFLETGSQHL
jgi:hypothetical protein